MAKPQLENGYLKIANELFDAIIKFRIPGECRQVFDAIMRLTYGYNKKMDFVPHSQLANLTGLDRRVIHRAICKLEKHRLITKFIQKVAINNDDKKLPSNKMAEIAIKSAGRKYGNYSMQVVAINKTYDEWISFSKLPSKVMASKNNTVFGKTGEKNPPLGVSGFPPEEKKTPPPDQFDDNHDPYDEEYWRPVKEARRKMVKEILEQKKNMNIKQVKDS